MKEDSDEIKKAMETLGLGAGLTPEELAALKDPLRQIKDLTSMLPSDLSLSARSAEPVYMMSESAMENFIANPAEEIYNQLVEYIQEFEKGLDQEHENGAQLVSFGNTVEFRISNIGYYGPDIITFYGQDDQGRKLQLIQHISQLSVLLIGLKTIENRPPRRIGFNLEQKTSEPETDE